MSRRWLLVRLNGCGSSERGTETDEVRETQTVSQERVRDGESGVRKFESQGEREGHERGKGTYACLSALVMHAHASAHRTYVFVLFHM